MRRKTTLFGLLLSAIGTAASLMIYNSRGLTREREWSAQSGDIGSLLYTPDGKTLLSSGDAIRLWDPSTGTLKSTIPATGSIHGLSPAGNLVASFVTRRPNRRTVEYAMEF